MTLINTIIVLWSGAIVDIPDGWALCDGNNGLPDLRNRFLVGAQDIYPQDRTGGALQHNHNFSSMPHWHNIPLGNDLEGDFPTGDIHKITDSAQASGTTNNTGHLPPYYALAYIGKI